MAGRWIIFSRGPRWLYTFVALAAVFCLGGFGYWWAEQFQRANSAPVFSYEQIHQTFRRQDQQLPQHALLLLGDSHISALCEGCLNRPALNLGIGGDTMAGLNRRVRDYQMVREPSNIAIVEIGANDILWEGQRDLRAGAAELLQSLAALNHVFLYGIFPVSGSFTKAALNEQLTAANSQLQQVCSAAKNCSFESLQPLYGENGYLRDDLHVSDGVHLNAKAYALWAADIATKLENYP